MRKFFIIGISILLVNILTIPVFAVDYPTNITPSIDVRVNISNSSLASKSTFIDSLKALLLNKGINVSKLGINLTTTTTFDPASSALWYRYDHIGDWNERYSAYRPSYSGPTIHYAPIDETLLDATYGTDRIVSGRYVLDPHIITREDGTLVFYGYGSPAYRDFLISKDDTANDKHFTFTLDESAVSYHSMIGGGFLFGVSMDAGTDNIINTDVAGIGNDDTMSGYAIMYINGGVGLYQFSNMNIDSFHEASGSMTSLQNYSKPSGTLHNIDITITSGKLTLIDTVNNVATTVINEYTLPTIYGNRFGPITAYQSHGCQELSWFVYSNLNIATVQTTTETLYNSVDDISWTPDSTKFLINLDDVESKDWTSENIATMKSNLNSIYYVPVGNSDSYANENTVLENGQGQYFNQSDENLLQNIADYIYNIIKPQIIDNAKDFAENNVNQTSGLVDFIISGDSNYTSSNITVSNLLSNFNLDDEILNHDNVEIRLTIAGMDEADVPYTDLQSFQTYLSQLSEGSYSISYLNINLNQYINSGDAIPVTSTSNLVTITIPIPSNMQDLTNFKILRIHEGVQTIITPTVDLINHTLTFQTDRFSSYSIVGGTSELPGGVNITNPEPTGSAPEPEGNRAPIAKNYVFDTPKAAAFSGQVLGTDPDGDAVWYQLIGTGTSKGLLVFNTDGSFTYTLNANSAGADTFSYQICDSWKCSDVYTVTLTNGGGIPKTGVDNTGNWLFTIALFIIGLGLVKADRFIKN